MPKLPDVLLIDAQLPPSLVPFFRKNFSLQAIHVSDLAVSKDVDIFLHARRINAFILTKDDDFEKLILEYNAPPKILFIQYGNVGKIKLKELLLQNFEVALNALQEDENLDFITIK